ncbi:MAG: nickel pincer cofactor biosynthesis protein LarC [Saccharofermentans sp.]|nr:nickel pincer cofactor biosynthesis protein LarC [Saccharofermentans sp.]
MRTLYIECNMGAAGDMLTAALSELIPDVDAFMEKLKSLDIPGVIYERDYKLSCGIRGAHMHVYVNGEEEVSEDVHEHHHHEEHHHEHEHHHGHHHTSMADVDHIVNKLDVSAKVKKDILGIYNLIAEAESHAHGKPVSEIHFHEVGNMDAIADVTAVCLLMELIGADRIVCSPVHVGSGNVRCAHGVLPVPTPATAHILQGVPMYGGRIKGELCTPTGAAILKYFADEFGDMPAMITEKIGIGSGNKEFEAANIVRVFVGESEEKKPAIVELNCNLDDATGEELGFTLNLLMDEGALDAFIVPVQMKKSRPGYMVVVMAKEEDSDRITNLLLKHTTTLGVRKKICERTVMNREVSEIETSYGTVRVKNAWLGDIHKSKPEYEDVARIALNTGKSYREVVKELNL